MKIFNKKKTDNKTTFENGIKMIAIYNIILMAVLMFSLLSAWFGFTETVVGRYTTMILFLVECIMVFVVLRNFKNITIAIDSELQGIDREQDEYKKLLEDKKALLDENKELLEIKYKFDVIKAYVHYLKSPNADENMNDILMTLLSAIDKTDEGKTE